jgi:hypothetical protein
VPERPDHGMIITCNVTGINSVSGAQ